MLWLPPAPAPPTPLLPLQTVCSRLARLVLAQPLPGPLTLHRCLCGASPPAGDRLLHSLQRPALRSLPHRSLPAPFPPGGSEFSPMPRNGVPRWFLSPSLPGREPPRAGPSCGHLLSPRPCPRQVPLSVCVRVSPWVHREARWWGRKVELGLQGTVVGWGLAGPLGWLWAAATIACRVEDPSSGHHRRGSYYSGGLGRPQGCRPQDLVGNQQG